MIPSPANGLADAPAGCNTFAVPMMATIFGNSTVSWHERGPLVPWQVNGVESLRVWIDDTEELLRRFTHDGPKAHLVVDTEHEAGHLVVVSGGRKSGKTTFLHLIVHRFARDVHALVDRQALPAASEQQPWTAGGAELASRIRIVAVAGPENNAVAMGYEDGLPGSVKTVHRRILQKIRDKLAPELGEAVPAEINSDDLYSAYKALSKALISWEKVLLVILPDYHWNDRELTRLFYQSCSFHAMTGIVFFVESSNSATESDLGIVTDDPKFAGKVTHLKIGPLKPQDCRGFIEARHRAAGIPGPLVRLADEVLNGPSEFWAQKSIGRLQEMLYAVSQDVHKNGKEEINAAVLRDYIRIHRPVDVAQFERRR